MIFDAGCADKTRIRWIGQSVTIRVRNDVGKTEQGLWTTVVCQQSRTGSDCRAVAGSRATGPRSLCMELDSAVGRCCLVTEAGETAPISFWDAPASLFGERV
jgi:hypothetical protein